MRPRVANAITFDNFWFFLGLVSIAPFLIISYYNQPSVDDFYFTVKSQSIGALNAQIEWYLTWTGRYFSTFILSINPLVYNNLMLYKAIPVLLIAGLWLSLSFLVQAVFINIKTKQLFFISTSTMMLFFFQMPSISQGVYWLAGAVTYQLGNILFVLCLCSLIRFLNKKQTIDLLYTIFLAFAVIGSNETSMLLLDFTVIVIFLISSFQRKKADFHLALLLLFMAVFSVIVLRSPGNSIRAGYFTNNHQIIYTITESFKLIYSIALEWLPFTICMSLVLFDYINKNNIQFNTRFFDIHPSIAFLFLCALLFIAYLPGLWSLGTPPPARTINVIYFTFIGGCFYFLCTIHVVLKKNSVVFLPYSPYVKYFMLILILINLYKPNNIKTAWGDLFSRRASLYNEQVYQRYELVRKTASDNVTVPKLINTPKTIFVSDISENSNDWTNKGFADYMKKKSIVITTQ